MAGRRVFFSFHYEDDVWRASNVRNSRQFDAVAAAGWNDASLWEAARRRGDTAVRRLIDDALKGTSVTAVLIGARTASRRWVNYEISESIKRGNGLLGVRIHNIKDQFGRKAGRGDVPRPLAERGYPTYGWDRETFGRRVELAAIRAGKPCSKHRQTGCVWCNVYFTLW